MSLERGRGSGVTTSLTLEPVEPIDGSDDVHPDLTDEEVNVALRALFAQAEKGRASLIDAVPSGK